MEMRKTTATTSHEQHLLIAALFAALAVAGSDALAQTGAVASETLSKQQAEPKHDDAALAAAALNPIAALISLPLQYNYDQDIGPQRNGHKNYLNIQPVIPFSISQDWNLISRTIVPLIDIDLGGGTSSSGMGDITQSLFFSPKALTESGWTWGVGPVIVLPTGTKDFLGGDQWALGPTAVLLKQEHGWTYGALVNHVWSVGGSGGDISNTFLQPFLSYTTKSLTTFTIQTESSYDWERKHWSVPIHALVSQFFKVGEQKMTFQVGARYWAESPDAGAHGWGARATLTLLFPAH
jgi:hypothetical protein